MATNLPSFIHSQNPGCPRSRFWDLGYHKSPHQILKGHTMSIKEQHIEAAITRCHEAWIKALKAYALKANRPLDLIEVDILHARYAGQAYRNELPYLTSSLQIDTYIACVTHGMDLRAIEAAEGAKLLYAAQVALASRRVQLEEAKHQAKQQTTPTPSTPTADSLTSSGEAADSLSPNANPPTRHGEAANPPKNTQTPPTPSPSSSATHRYPDALIAHATELLRQATLKQQKRA